MRKISLKIVSLGSRGGKLSISLLLAITFLICAVPVPAEEIHPRLYFNPSDLTAIRNKNNQPMPAKVMRQIVKRAEDFVVTDFSDINLQENQKDGQAALLSFLVLYLPTSDPNRALYASKAKQALLHINDGVWKRERPEYSARLNWDGSNDVTPYLPGIVLGNYAMAYDFLVGAGELTGLEREKVAARLKLLMRIEYAAQQSSRLDVEDGFVVRGSNKRIISISGVGLAALLFPEQNGVIADPENLLAGRQFSLSSAECLQYALNDLFVYDLTMPANDDARQGTLANFLAPDGIYDEGIQYQNASYKSLFLFLSAYLKSNPNKNYFLGGTNWDARLMRSMEWSIKSLMPSIKSPTIRSTNLQDLLWGHSIVARFAPKAPWHQWYFENYGWMEDGYVPAYIFYQPPAGPVTPPAIRTEFATESSHAVFRDKWGADATYLYMIGNTRPTKSSHHQVDQSSFIMYAKNAYMVIDPGQGRIYRPGPNDYQLGGPENRLSSAFGANTIVEGPAYDSTAPVDYRSEAISPNMLYTFSRMIDGAYMRNNIARDRMDYAEWDMNYSKTGVNLRRTVAFPRHRYFLILDNVSAGAERDFTWQAHLGGKSSEGVLTSVGTRKSWTMPNEIGGKSVLDIDFLTGPSAVVSDAAVPTDIGITGPFEKFEHTLLRGTVRSSNQNFLTMLNPRFESEAPLTVTALSRRVWKVQLTPDSYDLIVMQPTSQAVVADVLDTNATFLVASIDIVDGKPQVHSVTARGGTYFKTRTATEFNINTNPGDVYYLNPAGEKSPESERAAAPADLDITLQNNAIIPGRNDEMQVLYTVRVPGHLEIGVYTAKGEHVASLFSGDVGIATSQVAWRGANDDGGMVASGIYLIKSKLGDSVVIKKCAVVK